MRYKNQIIVFGVFLIVGFCLFFFKGESKTSSPFFLVLAFLIAPILGFLFPRLKELGIGTSSFLPNILRYFKEK